MKYKRAIGIGVFVYLVTMLIGMGVGALLGIQPAPGEPIPKEMWMASAVLAIVLSIGAAHWYFRSKSLVPSFRAGLAFGGVLIVVGFVLDVLFFLLSSFEGHDPFALMFMYYRQPAFWITLVLILFGSGSMGVWLEKKKNAVQ